METRTMCASLLFAIYLAVLVAEVMPDEATAAAPLPIAHRSVPPPTIYRTADPLRVLNPGQGREPRRNDLPEEWASTSNPPTAESWVSVPMRYSAPTSTNTAHGTVTVRDGVVVIANTGTPYIGGY